MTQVLFISGMQGWYLKINQCNPLHQQAKEEKNYHCTPTDAEKSHFIKLNLSSWKKKHLSKN